MLGRLKTSSCTGRIHLVSGPSSSGKSTFIKRFLQDYDAVLFPSRKPLQHVNPTGHYAFHYNILRPFSHSFEPLWWASPWQFVRQLFRKERAGRENLFSRDPILKALLRCGLVVNATILVVPASVIKQRLSQRTTTEPQLAGTRKPRAYPTEKWSHAFETVDLGDFYRQWFEFLEMNQISFCFVDSSDSRYGTIARDNSLLDFLSRREPHVSAALRDGFA